MPRFPYRDLLLILALTLIARTLVIASGSVTFHADEGIVAIMAHRILQGEHMVFFLGQAYMGSLNAYTAALGFALLGEQIGAIRVMQAVMYLIAVGTGYWAAWHLSKRRGVALTAGLVMALPPVTGVLYTTVNIGGYIETLIFSNLLIILAFDLGGDHGFSVWRWLALGFVSGLAWWTNGLIVMVMIPVALWLLITLWRLNDGRLRYMSLIGVALLTFVLGSAPFWWFNFTHQNAALAALFPFFEAPSEFATVGIEGVPATQRMLLLMLFGIPALVGMRFPWSGDFFLAPLGLVVLLINIAAVYWLIRKNSLPNGGRFLIVGTLINFVLVFVASSFGSDPTGRYFIVLILPVGIAVGTLVADLPRWAASGLVLVIVGYYTAGTISAAQTVPPGITTQFDLISHFSNTYDADLLAFLQEQDIQHGYTTYWIAIRLAFLSGEQIQFNSALPYKADLSYNPADNRIPEYVVATAQADRIAYITTVKLPELDDMIVNQLATLGITYEIEMIGDFIVYYDFIQDGMPVTPPPNF